MKYKNRKILIIDDNKQILDSLSLLLKNEFETIETIKNPNLIPNRLESESFDVILLDMNFSAGINSGNEGFFWLKEILKIDPFAIVILITAYSDIEIAVRAIKEGATDFISKPWDAEKLVITLQTAVKLRRTKLEVNSLKAKEKQLTERINKPYPFIVGPSKIMEKIIITLNKISKTDANILILGENGTGKELIAREIHNKSKRSSKIFLNVDMASLSESLFESELFGHVKGAYTDAKSDREGRFETASGGTLFLDEIGNLPLSLQAKILNAVQNKQIIRLGSNKSIPVDIRLICATNKPLHTMVEEGLFREDLLYRINTIQIETPPLRERKEDIPKLTEHFLKQYTVKYEKPLLKINNEALKKLSTYTWPGNIRELKHTIEKSVILCESNILNTNDFTFKEDKNKILEKPELYKLSEIEHRSIQNVLKLCNGNMTKAAKLLDISRTTLYTKIQKYDL